jgi:hypothetical protein
VLMARKAISLDVRGREWSLCFLTSVVLENIHLEREAVTVTEGHEE